MMRGKRKMAIKTVSINGRLYDKHTGLPVTHTDKLQPKMSDVTHHAHARTVHARTERSKTLNRRYVRRHSEVPARKQATEATESPKQPVKEAHQAHPQHKITKYAPHPQAAVKHYDHDAGPVVHPMVQTVHAARAHKHHPSKKQIHKPSDIIKAEAIETALANASSHHQKPAKQQRSGAGRHFSLASGAAALLLLVGYFTYLNMPNLSVRVAAAQAGIEADYPDYRPSGYSISGPVAYETGRVQMKFAANGGNQSFVLNQERSGWDSGAVLEDYVLPQAGEDYIISRERGLTIYSWNGNAAWVSGGILYTVNGDALLSPEQIRRIATSL
jgi:hypothetical protein